MDNSCHSVDDVCRGFEQSVQRLVETIAEAPRAMQGSLLATAQRRLKDAQLNVPPAPAISRKSRARRRKFERGMEIERSIEAGHPVTDKEIEANIDLWYFAVCDIALGCIQDEIELKTLKDGIRYVMERDKFDGNVDDAIDYALSLAYDIMEVNEEAWLIALARFGMRGYGAPAWRRDVPRGRFGYGAPGAAG